MKVDAYGAITTRGKHWPTTRLWVGDTSALLRDWAQAVGMPTHTLIKRLNGGWDLLDALAAESYARMAFEAWPYALDPDTQRVVEENQGGMGVDEIAKHIGLSRRRVDAILESALRNVRHELHE